MTLALKYVDQGLAKRIKSVAHGRETTAKQFILAAIEKARADEADGKWPAKGVK